MRIEIQFYGILKQRADTESVTVTFETCEVTVADAVASLEHALPQLAGTLDGVARVVDDEIVGDDHRLDAGSSLALLPPVSGGCDGSPYLSANALDRQQLIDETADDRCGALVVFSGDVRNHNAGRDDVVAIEYEAHETMAAQVLGTIEAESVDRFDVRQCRIQHRTGRVEVGESSVLVVCRAPHRDDAFRGARYAIDELKSRAPLWKREHYADGDSRYLDGTPLSRDDR